ncbi:hypothetical protein HWV62_14330 [Athelia sp. TMB]|nr:hypothetical protein HWV62_14330 [Athelia sp. TMB]
MGGLFSAIARWFGGQQATENPVFEAINEQERIAEEDKVQAALAEQERLRSVAEREAQEARDAKNKADQERKTAEEDARRAEESRKEEEKRAKEAQENAEKYKQEGERERQKAEESAERERVAQEEAKRVKERAEAAAAVAKAQQEAAEEAGRVAREEAQKARQDAEEARRKWREGIQPEVWPTKDALNRNKMRLGYVEGSYHFAVAGISGGGKSSLINALRGVTNGSQFAADTGITETTTEITRYLDPDHPSLPFVWYDAPGAGTLSIPGWQYFDQQGLYIFDSIIVLFDNRFTATDIAILQNCARFKIPSYIVRSKSDQHLGNVLKDVCKTYKKDKLSATELHKRAKDKYIKETRESVERELKKAPLPLQPVYMVSQDILCHLRIDKGLGDPDMIDEDGTVDEDVLLANIIDEEELLRDILMNAKDRRPPTKRKAASQPTGLISRVGNILSSMQNATKSGSVAEHAPPRKMQPDSLLTASHPEQNGSGPALTGCPEPDDDYVLADTPPPDAIDVDV